MDEPKVYTLTPQGVVLAKQFEDGDRLFRDSWVSDGDVVKVDMDKARDIHMQRIRKARADALEANDTAWLTATKKGDTAAVQAAGREAQRLRDLPKTVDLSVASTPAELAAIWPEGLR